MAFPPESPAFLLIQRFGQPPVHDQRLAVLAEHDVARLQVAVQHPAAVGVGNGVAHVDEPAQQLAQRQRPLAGIAAGDIRLVKAADGVLEVVAPDEAHGVERPAIGVLAQAVDRHDARDAPARR